MYDGLSKLVTFAKYLLIFKTRMEQNGSTGRGGEEGGGGGQMKMNLSLFQVLIALDIVGFTRSGCPSHTHTRTRTHALCWKMRVGDFYKISWELIEVTRVLLLGEG